MYQIKTSGMTFKKRSGIYSNSTGSLTFDPIKLEAHSYRWWKFVSRIDGVVIFNSYSYSVSTSKHQSKIRSMLDQMGIKIDVFLKLKNGINTSDLEALFLEAEEQACDKFLSDELKRQDRNERSRIKRAEAKKKALESALGRVADCTEIYRSLDKVNDTLTKDV